MGKDVENKKNLSPEKGADDSGCLSLRNAREMAVANGKSLTEVEGLAVNDGIIPLRYQRNIGSIMLSEQRILMDARVAIIG